MTHQNPTDTNPLLQAWDTPYGLPPFGATRPEHFAPALEAAMASHLAEIEAIAKHPETATFENTLAALDSSGRLFNRVSGFFHNMVVSETSPALQAVETAMAPKLAAHENAIFMHAGLFARIDTLHQQRLDLKLDSEQLRLLERVHLDFVRAGAKLDEAARHQYSANVQKLASLQTQFSQNVLADEASFTLPLEGDADLAGLPASLKAAAASAAAARGLPDGSHVITLSPSLAEPFLTLSPRRDLREKLWRARKDRGAHPGSHDNRPIAQQILALRQQQASLHGFDTYADYQLTDRMARTPQAVLDLLTKAWEPAKAYADVDRNALTEMAKRLGEATQIVAWDWQFLAEKVRAERFDLDDTQVKPYFALDNMIAAMFDCAHRLFGLTFVEKPDVPLYHPDARLWEVHGADGQLMAVFIGDNFARVTKRSGAWMSVFRSQSGINGGTYPVVINNNNFAKASPTLLSFDDVRTLFHEFGHGLHGMLSKVHYERLAGTSVLQDFVELPSQIFENWALEPEVLQKHARHFETGEPAPAALLKKLKSARQFNQAWATIQYAGPALIDMALHALPSGTEVDLMAFETEQRNRLGVPADIGQRHYLSHFQHLFSGESYAAGYYVYMWAEVLEADGFEAFTETGNAFDPTTAQRLYTSIYSAGNRQAPDAAYRAFRGRDPQVEPMLRKRGLLAPALA